MRLARLPHLAYAAGAMLTLFVLLSHRAWPEEELGPVPPRGSLDLKGVFDPLEKVVTRGAASRRSSGLPSSWHHELDDRAPRMRRRLKDLRKTSMWVTDPETKEVFGLVPAKWSPFTRTLASLHTDVGLCEQSYRKARVDPEFKKRVWRKRFPGPEPIGRVPSLDALEEVQRSIRALQRQRLVVPQSLWEAERRLIARVEEEEERERERNRREYEERRQVAFAEFEREAAATNRLLRQEAEVFDGYLKSLREFVAKAQEIEEERLAEILAKMPEDAAREKKANDLFAKMRAGRAKAVRFSNPKLSRYIATLQQGWMVHRAKLVKLIEKG